MILLYVKRILMVTAAAASCYGLADWLGPPAAATIWTIATAAGCALGAALLRTSEVGRVTWRNHAAGCLIPWGWRLNRGRLWVAAAVSWVAWVTIGAAVFVLRAKSADDSTALRVGLFAAWAVDAAALLFVLGTIRQATPGSRVGSLGRVSVFLALILAVSVGLHAGGLTAAAVAVGAGPPAVIGSGLILFALLMVTVGRNARWN